MKKRLLLTMTMLLLAVATMFAVPAKPGVKKKVTLKDGSVVELSLRGDEHFSYYTDASGNACQLQDGQLVRMSKETKVYHFTVIDSPSYQLLFLAYTPLYMNYLAVRQGHWTAEELDLISYPSSQASRRAVSTESYESTTNSYTLTNMDASRLYSYRLRAIGDNGEYSGWSALKTMSFGTTGVQSITTNVQNDHTVRYFDLQGRAVPANSKGLLIRKQGSEVKKVIVK